MFAASRLLRMALCAVASITLAYGQAITGQFSGLVTDSSGASIPNAKITVTNPGTGAIRAAVTDQTGAYLVTLLPPGSYNLSAEANGFKKEVQSAVELQVNQAATINFTLQPGQVSETIEVTGAAPQLEAQSSSLGTVVDTQLTEELPLNGRNFVQLATLAPGVNGTGYSVSGTIMSGTRPDDRRPGTEIFSNGNREGSNDFLYDGIDDNDRLTLSIVLRPAIEAIREFKVQTNLFSADQGRNSGAVVDVVTKSGTNQIHGSTFEFLRNSAMDSRNFFNPTSQPFPSFRYNQFGGSLGGPIVVPKVYHGKDKTFFFMDYEGFRRNQQQISIVTIPTLAERTGNFTGFNPIFDPLSTTPTATSYTRTQFPGNMIPASRFDPITIKMVNAYPAPTASGNVNNYTENLNQVQNWDQGDIRVDQQITSTDSFFARYSIQHTNTIVPASYPDATIPGIPHPVPVGDEASFAGTSAQPVQHAVAAYTHVFSPSLINDFRLGFQRFVVNYTLAGTTPTENLGDELGVANSNWNALQTALPIFSPSGYLGVGMSRSLPIERRENTYEEVDNLTWTKGKHTFRFGADVRRRQVTEYQTNQGNGRFNFSTGFTAEPGVSSGDSIASMLLGYPTLEEQDYLLVWDGMRGVEVGGYFADDWRVNNKLTLNIGLRWEYYSPYSEVANRIANFNLATVKLMVPGQNGVNDYANVGQDWTDFAPRFGFAYQALSHTVVRGGFGLFYNPNGNGGAVLRLDRQAPYGPIYEVSPGDEFVGPEVDQGLPPNPGINLADAALPTGNTIGIPGNFKNAYAEQFNLTLEQEVAPWKTLFKLAGIGNLGRRLGTAWNPNQPLPGPGATTPRRPLYAEDSVLGDINYYTSDGLSEYYALQFTAEKRYSNGVTGLLGYTWAHAIDDVATDFGGGTGTPQDPTCRFCDRGNSAFDMRQRLTVSVTYQIPGFREHGLKGAVLGGWQLNGLLQSQTGLPYTPELQTATVNTGTASRPNLVGNPTLSNQTINLWFNPAAFGTPALYTYGNAGRDILFGPGRTNLDASLFKDFHPIERLTAQFRFESFNIFNHPQFGQPNANIGNGAAGTITSTVGNPRQMQVALRLVF